MRDTCCTASRKKTSFISFVDCMLKSSRYCTQFSQWRRKLHHTTDIRQDGVLTNILHAASYWHCAYTPSHSLTDKLMYSHPAHTPDSDIVHPIKQHKSVSVKHRRRERWSKADSDLGLLGHSPGTSPLCQADQHVYTELSTSTTQLSQWFTLLFFFLHCILGPCHEPCNWARLTPTSTLYAHT